MLTLNSYDDPSWFIRHTTAMHKVVEAPSPVEAVLEYVNQFPVTLPAVVELCQVGEASWNFYHVVPGVHELVVTEKL